MTTRYSRLALAMAPIRQGRSTLGPRESPHSTNGVTGESVNFPIVGTCKPSSVCVQTCYAGTGPITWSASLAKQWRAYGSCVDDPIGFATRVIKARTQDYIVWNGCGDLFDEAVVAVNYIGRTRPDIPVWVRTRRPKMATQIDRAPNVFVHFSLDYSSMNRQKQVAWNTDNWYWSYQYSPGETTMYPDGMGVVFGHDYKLPEGITGPAVCPLNTLDDVEGACARCRRCFTHPTGRRSTAPM